MLQRAVRALLDAQFVRVDAVPEELGVLRRRRPHRRSASRSSGTVGARGRVALGRDELHDAPHHLGDDPHRRPDQVMRLGDEEPLAERGPLRADDIGQLGGDADFFTGPQIAVVGLLAVGRDHADIACVVEQFEDLAQRVVVRADAAETHHRPHLDHRGRGDDAGMTGGLGRRLVDVDRDSCRRWRRASGRPSAG